MSLLDESEEQLLGELVTAVRLIAHGPTSGATGLEMVAMALAGEGLVDPVGRGLADIANAINESFGETSSIAMSLEHISKKLNQKGQA